MRVVFFFLVFSGKARGEGGLLWNKSTFGGTGFIVL